MLHSPRPGRPQLAPIPTNSSNSDSCAPLERRLLAYALAGLGAIVAAPLAGAEIVYTPADPGSLGALARGTAK
jgi:hypothetical protein